MITIGIPVFNGERFIEMAIKSVLNQTYSDFELIITDDGSTDNTVEIIKLFNDSRIKLIADGENHGISYRLNQQIDLAKGDYFVRMDADDIMFPERIEMQLKYLQEHLEIDVVGSGAVIIGDNNEILGIRQSVNSYKTIDSVFYGARFIHPTVMGRTEWFRKYKYRDAVKGCEDCDLWIRSYENTNAYAMQIPLLFYRDPLKFKLKTYLFRKKQLLKMWHLNNSLLPNKVAYIKLVFENCVTSCGAIVLSALKMDQIMIARRNKPIVVVKSYMKKLGDAIK